MSDGPSNFAACVPAPGSSRSYAYNGLDARVGSSGASYLRDGASPTAPLLSDGSALYTPGVSERRGGSTSFLHAGLKSADALSTPSQTLSASRTYDAYGNVVSSSGAWSGPFGYGGAYGYREEDGGLMLLGRRLYDPSAGRFLTRDPAEDGRNWYAYCEGDPVNRADAEGEFWFLVVIAIVALAAGGCSQSGTETPPDAVGVGAGTQASPGVSEAVGGGGALIQGTAEISRARLRADAAQACEMGVRQACDDTDAYNQGNGPPVFGEDGKPRRTYLDSQGNLRPEWK